MEKIKRAMKNQMPVYSAILRSAVTCVVLLILCSSENSAQGVGVNEDGSLPDASALLDVSSSRKGVLFPRVALSSINDVSVIPNPATSLLIYNTNASIVNGSGEGFYYYDGTEWVHLSSGGSSPSGDAWELAGNSGTTAGVDYIGTADSVDLVVKTNSNERMRVVGAGRVGVGTASPDASALVDMTSNNKGVLIPRLTTAERDAISSPAIGLQIYNTDCGALNHYNGTCWISVSSPLMYPGPITTSSTSFCSGDPRTFSVASVPGATSYSWTVPGGAVINSGQGTNTISATFANHSGNVCVIAYNSCEKSDASCIEVLVDPVPEAPGSITGLTTVLPSQSGVTYSVSGDETFTWTVPSGASITSGQGTNTILVDFSCSATSGDISVATSNDCGSGTPSTLAITVNVVVADAGSDVSSGTCPNSTTIGPASGSGGNGGYSYSWGPSGSLQSATSASPTPNICSDQTFTVTVTDANGCTATASMSYTWGDSSPLTIGFTDGSIDWTVPSGVSSITADIRGARGVSTYGSGGKGGRVETDISVTPGSVLRLEVGGTNGYNGGGAGGTGGNNGYNGGGASDIRQSPYALADRLAVAGGGGGQGGYGANGGGNGGDGGQVGQNGQNGTSGAPGGSGATQSAGGAGGSSGSYSGTAGTLGVGGDGGDYWSGGSGGGGGYYGGGGGAGGNWCGGTSCSGAGGGGGGSSYSSGTNTTYTTGYQSGNGQIIISW